MYDAIVIGARVLARQPPCCSHAADRKPYGMGWALVSVASYNRDPITRTGHE